MHLLLLKNQFVSLRNISYLNHNTLLRIIMFILLVLSVKLSCTMTVYIDITLLQAEWMAPEVLRNEPSDEKYVQLLCKTAIFDIL